MSDFKYIGEELDLFADAHNWKSYWVKYLQPFVAGHVLEVGAGIGTNTPLFAQSRQVTRITCLEPDPGLAERLSEKLFADGLDQRADVVVGDTTSLAGRTFDTIVYIDVIEHIEDDRGELARGAALASRGGHVIALSPAHNWLFTPFDAAIGHFRRYSRRAMAALEPPGTTQIAVVYLDSVGLFASLANKLMLRKSMPSPGQIKLWDRFMVPCSRVLDPLLGRRVGKTVVGVWKKN